MHDDLITVAKHLAAGRKARPSQAELRRALSTAYYPLFHAFASDAANQLVGQGSAVDRAWDTVYRALDHRLAVDACKPGRISGFSPNLRACAARFIVLQDRRHRADYDPRLRLTRAEVLADIVSAEDAVAMFFRCGRPDRRAFAVHLLFRARN